MQSISEDISYNNILRRAIPVSLVDNDIAGLAFEFSDGSPMQMWTVAEGQLGITVNVTLASRPRAVVHVDIPFDRQLIVNPSSFVFGPDNYSQVRFAAAYNCCCCCCCISNSALCACSLRGVGVRRSLTMINVVCLICCYDGAADMPGISQWRASGLWGSGCGATNPAPNPERLRTPQSLTESAPHRRLSR
jgi:hypothetical protein